MGEEERREAAKETAARCQQQAAQVMGWWQLELGQLLGLIKGFALRQQLQHIAWFCGGGRELTVLTGSQGRCCVSLTLDSSDVR